MNEFLKSVFFLYHKLIRQNNNSLYYFVFTVKISSHGLFGKFK